MKVLLLGAYSGFYKNLKEGLRQLGVQVTHAASGDGFKRIPVDLSFDLVKDQRVNRYLSRVVPITVIKKLQDYDVVQLVNPFAFHSFYSLDRWFYNRLIKQNKKVFVSAAGDDAYFWRVGRSVLKYGPFDDFLRYDKKTTSYYMSTDQAFEYNRWLVAQSHGVIPVMYEYERSYESCDKRLRTIPLPINLKNIAYRENSVHGKLVVLHGLNRYGFKGTRHVEQAFEILSRRYPNDLELIIKGNLPLDQYLKLMQRVNVVVDQMYSYSLGMNGLYALAMGKVVLGGAEPEGLRSLGITSTPVINVAPSANELISVIERLLDCRSQLPGIGRSGRGLVAQVHDHVRIAERYLETWREH